jgi:hypothetical protein
VCACFDFAILIHFHVHLFVFQSNVFPNFTLHYSSFCGWFFGKLLCMKYYVSIWLSTAEKVYKILIDFNCSLYWRLGLYFDGMRGMGLLILILTWLVSFQFEFKEDFPGGNSLNFIAFLVSTQKTFSFFFYFIHNYRNLFLKQFSHSINFIVQFLYLLKSLSFRNRHVSEITTDLSFNHKNKMK